MILLRLISWPYARKHLPRCLLTIAGIVLGVAVFVGMHTANQSVLAAFHQTIDRIAGSTQLQVSAGDAGFDEEVLDKVRDVVGVRAAAPAIESSVTLQGQTHLLILGVDMLGDRSLRSYDFDDTDTAIDDPLVFLAQPDSLIVTSVFALFIGMFIIYNTFAIAVTQRRSEIGILRALGATRAQIRTLFLTESAIAGLVGATAGVAVGIVLARAMAGYIGGFLED